MNNLVKTTAGILLLLCCAESEACWPNRNVVVQQIPGTYQFQYPVYNNAVGYQPIVTQSLYWTPVVQNRVEYVPVVRGGYYMNYGTYYSFPVYVPQQSYDQWRPYNY